MKFRPITFFSIAIIILFIFSILNFANNIYEEYTSSVPRLQTITQDIQNYLKTDNTKAIKMLSTNDSVANIKVLKDDKTIIINSTPQEEYEYSKTIKLTQERNLELDSQTANYKVQLTLYTVRPTIIFQNIKHSFIVILIATLLTSFYIFYLSVRENYALTKSKENDEKDIIIENKNKEQNVQEINITDINKESSPAPITTKTEEIKDSKTEQKNEEIDIEKVIDNAKPDEEEMISFDDMQIPTAVQNSMQEDEKEDYSLSLTENDEVQKAEPSFEEILENNISWQLQGDKELSLLILNPECKTQSYSDITNKIKDICPQDTIVSSYDNLIRVILPNVNIDQAEDFASKIHESIVTSKNEDSCAIGLSSLATRTINAQRLITEATEALKHAELDKTSQIIGFHVDIEKYHEFMNQE